MESILQQEPAQTLNYMIAGYAIIFGLISIYVLSLMFRLRKIAREIQLLRKIMKKEDPRLF